MQVALRIWRHDAATGDRALRDYELDAPDDATLLDCLTLIKDRVDGTLAFRKSCRMTSCGACGMRMDGVSVLACATRMADVAAAGRAPVIAPMGNLPVIRDLVVDMEPFWAKYRAMKPWLQPGYDALAEGDERGVRPYELEAVRKESLCINCGCCVSECNAMESDPDFLGPHALAHGMRFVGDPRDGHAVERLEAYSDEHGIWDCTRCYFCNERCPKGVDPRDSIAKLGAEAVARKVDRDPGARVARWHVTSTRTTGWLREGELVPRALGPGAAARQARFGLELARHGKLGPLGPTHVANDAREARRLYDLVKSQGRDGAAGIVQGERGLDRAAEAAPRPREEER